MDASDMARALGRKGGTALHASRRIAENFRYVEAMDALRPRPPVTRLRDFAGPLPGIYASQPGQK